MTIKLYTGPACTACSKLKKRLNSLDITSERFEEADVNEPKHREAVVALGFRGIPLLVKFDEETGKAVKTLMGASYPDKKYKEFFAQ